MPQKKDADNRPSYSLAGEPTECDARAHNQQMPPIEWRSEDYDGYFYPLVEGWIKKHANHHFKIEKICVSIGQYRSYDVKWEVIDAVLYLDFYSVARRDHVRIPDEIITLV